MTTYACKITWKSVTEHLRELRSKLLYVKSSLTAIQRISNCAVGFVNHPALGSMNFLTDQQLLPTNQDRIRKLMFPFFTISRGRRQLLEGLKKWTRCAWSTLHKIWSFTIRRDCEFFCLENDKVGHVFTAWHEPVGECFAAWRRHNVGTGSIWCFNDISKERSKTHEKKRAPSGRLWFV